MARWKLMDKHYLNGHFPGEDKNQWEYSEMNGTTGRMIRRHFNVPMYLDPADPSVQTPPKSGECIVCYEGKGLPTDIVFVGPPSPEMEPLDDEAQALSDKESPKWNHPIESLPGQGGFNESLLAGLNAQLDALFKQRATQPASALPLSAVPPDQLSTLTAQMAEMQKQMQALMARNAQLEAGSTAAPVVDNEEPLVDINPDAPPSPPPLVVDRPVRRA